MRTTTVIGLSLAAHGALFAGLARMALPRTVVPAQHVQTAVSIEEHQPIDVVMLSEPAVAPAIAAPSAAPSAAPREHRVPVSRRAPAVSGAQQVAAMSSSAGTELPGVARPQAAETGSGSGTAPGSGLMRMRTTPVLTLGEETAGKIPGTPYVAPVEPKVSGRVHTLPGGRAVIDDRVATFDVSKDGTLKITDKPDIDLHWHLPIPDIDLEEMREDLGKQMTDWLKDPEAGKKFGSMADVSRVWKAVPGACNDWADTWCDDELAPGAEKYARDEKRADGSIAGGTADLTAYAMRKLGVGDPYASRKLKLLADTRDERIAMGQRYRNEQLEKSAEIVEKTLEWLWAREHDPARRRQALFELWDDCEEGEGPRGQAGQRARAMILGWIGGHLPKGSPGAYSDEEIHRLDAARTSKQSFTPY